MTEHECHQLSVSIAQEMRTTDQVRFLLSLATSALGLSKHENRTL